jgi:ATP-dependent Lhr-like helicase
MHWRHLSGVASDLPQTLSGASQRVVDALAARGALFFLELVQTSGLLRVQVEDALGELVARGLVTADSFNGLRALLTPQSRRSRFRGRGASRGTSDFDAAGRWALLDAARPETTALAHEEAVEHAAKALLRRYGVVCRRLLDREALAPSWRELLRFYRGAEARGEIRGGRFIEPLGGEQFALIEAVEELRRLRRNKDVTDWVVIAAADPLNLTGLLDNAPRAPAQPSRRLAFKNGTPVAAGGGPRVEWLAELSDIEQRHVVTLLSPETRRPDGQRARRWSLP